MDYENKNTPELIDLDKILQEKAPKLYKKIPSFFMNYMKRKIHVDELNEILTIYSDQYGVDFMQSLIHYFNLDLKVEGLDKIDPEGRYVFASNHPLGGLDGICLSAIVGERFDKKIKYLVNDVLYNIKNLRPIFVPINKYGTQMKEKMKGINDAYASENQIITFPAGLCSRKTNGKIIDSDWQKSFIQKAVEYKRDIVPVFFEARNSNFFYSFAFFRKALGIKFNIELFFLPDEMFKNKNKRFRVKFGTPISWTLFDFSKKTAKEWAKDIKDITYSLAPADDLK